MSVDSTKREQMVHGTHREPVWSMDFEIGPDKIYTRPFYVEPHWHPSVELLWILEGEFEVEVNLETFSLHPGEFCLIGPEELHQIQSRDPRSHHRALLFDPRIFDFTYEDRIQEELFGPLLRREIMPVRLLTPDCEGFDLISPLLKAAFETAIAAGDDWYISCKLLLIRSLCTMSRFHCLNAVPALTASGDLLKVERFKTIASYIEEHLSEPIALEDLAALINCSSAYFCRFFREISGQSPIRYVIGRRIDLACRLLETTEKPVLTISLEAGFDNVSYFIRKFRQLKGMTPGEYRNFTRTPGSGNRRD